LFGCAVDIGYFAVVGFAGDPERAGGEARKAYRIGSIACMKRNLEKFRKIGH